MINYLIPPYMALTSRMHGGLFHLPKILNATLYAAPYVIAVFLAFSNSLLALCTLAWCILWKNTAHEDAFEGAGRAGAPLSYIAEPVAKIFNADRSTKTYDFIYWMIKGFLIALVPALLLHNLWLLFFSTIAYAVSYAIGYKIGYADTVIGESLGGFIAGLGFLM